ncbi:MULTISPECIES: asparagine synthase-related protein [Cronobacter]|uniref:asparagine synthase-related protein n=1 Tax=Cronobacter TaxID=413496 RepID=UPI000CFDE0BF|nr:MULTISPECIES: asparagine synthase-related protein [Cronobacter]ELY2738209.1 hypothetical protein [Cronobacter dublinensis]ELY2857291.1 hypothetical protein [Cronobacter dublinensis]ELY2909558.1 hypothetical protein [Cronobacter dublinensis]ELY3818232.1 hypothetical protein [Cronobacter sakazakii]ELY3834461.1 hypothetical protein [Cronobacter sakazakii]
MLVISEENVQVLIPGNADVRVFKKGRFYIALSDEYTVFHSGKDLLIFHGECVSRTGVLIEPAALQEKALLSHIQKGFGYFFLAKINEVGVEIYRSLERVQDVFYSTSGRLCISSRIEIVLAVTGINKENTEFLKAFINGMPTASFLSPYKNIRKILGGCKTLFKNNLSSITSFIDLSPCNENHLSEMSETIYNRTKNKNIWLNFSSGLDSTIIFLLLKESGLKFEAVHHGPTSEEHDSEVYEASVLCKKYGIRLHVMTPVHQASPSDQTGRFAGGSAFLQTQYVSDTFSYDEHSSSDNIYLNGQGGDTLYVQNPSYLIGTQLLAKAKPLRALRALDDLSKLKNSSLPGLIKKSVLSLRDKTGASPTPVHPLLTTRHSDAADYEHLLQILSFTETLPEMTATNLNAFSPIMTPGAIRTWRAHQYEKNFNADYDRYLIREMAFKRFGETHLWKRRKRSSVNLAHGLLLHSRHILDLVLENEEWVNATGLKKESLKKIINKNIHGHFDNQTNMLVALITLYDYYLFINKARESVNHVF